MSDTEGILTLVEQVCDEESFLRFVSALRTDWEDERAKEAVHPSSPYGPGANGWESGSIGAFLEAACAWADDTKKGTPFGYTPPANVWRRCAQILYAGKFYE